MFVFYVILLSIIVQCLGDTDTSILTKCGLNEVFVECKTTCPPQACNLAYTEYLCDPNPNPKCEPGCDCIKDYLRDDDGNCIYNEDCPYPIACGFNEVPSKCKQTCPPQDCDFSYDKYACKPGPCQPGCNCIGTYLRNSSGICVPKDQCDSDEDCKPNIVKAKASSSSSSSSSHAHASSSIKRNSANVPSNPTEYPNCNGDRNATFQEYPRPCKSSCKNPNCIRNDQIDSSGCECNPLYLTSDEGKCILPDDCPGGNPCPQNETFVYCNAGCPTNYCPKDDNRAIFACSPPYPCPSGCACKANYKRLSSEDDRCILASDCPPVTCTRENEEWNSCPPSCFTDTCRDINEPPRECYQSGPDCQPQCVCKEGYCRNDSDICVPISNC